MWISSVKFWYLNLRGNFTAVFNTCGKPSESEKVDDSLLALYSTWSNRYLAIWLITEQVNTWLQSILVHPSVAVYISSRMNVVFLQGNWTRSRLPQAAANCILLIPIQARTLQRRHHALFQPHQERHLAYRYKLAVLSCREL